MSAVENLSIWIEGTRVGNLQYDQSSGLFSLLYSPEWLNDPHAYPLSPPLDVARVEDAPLHSGQVRRFFENLLPEGEALEDAARASKLSRTNLMGLMRALGRETTGALSLFAEDASPVEAHNVLRSIEYEELSQRIRERAQLPFGIWDGRVRMSIAGLQDKLAVYRAPDGSLNLVEGALASTHILKPAPRGDRLPHLVVNEHFCMRFAAAIGVKTAPVELLRVPEPVLLVERFDRIAAKGQVHRIHIIDACQALDLSPGYKYERNFGGGQDVAHIRDGANYEKIFGLTRFGTIDVGMKMALLRWTILQALIGNSDAHGKNLSFFVKPHGLEIAPAYDLVSTLPYENIEHEWAMGIGDNFKIATVSSYDWADFAHRCGVEGRLLAREMRRAAKLAKEKNKALLEWEGYVKAEKKFLQDIVRLIDVQADQLMRIADEVPRVKL